MYNLSGGASNYLCVTDTPQWGNVISGLQPWSSYLSGCEYENGIIPPMFSLENNGGQSLMHLSPPCVVCHVSDRSTKIMVPAMTNCPAGWTKEYGGYLVSQSTSTGIPFYRSTYVCLDQAPEVLPSMAGNTDGALFYVVEGDCGSISLPCPPYIDGYEITCVVCTK